MNLEDMLVEIIETDSRIFSNREVFEMSYIPDIYKYRDMQLTRMAMFSSSIRDNIAPKNLHLTGGNATGKTTTLKQFFKMLNEFFPNVETVYVNCQVDNTENAVYGQIYSKIYNFNGSMVGKSNATLFSKIIERLKSTGKILVIGLDDYDSFKSMDGLNKLLYNFLRIHEKEEGVQISIFTVSNMRDLCLEPSVETIFNRIPILFDQYSLDQMFHILKDRCEYGFKPNVISEELVKAVAKKAYDVGNLRYGIRLLSDAGQKADMVGADKIIRNFID